MIRVMRIVWENKHQISNPDSFSDKIRRTEKRDAKKAQEGSIKRLGTSSSFGSSVLDRSQKTGLSDGSSNTGSDANGSQMDDEDGDVKTTTIANDPIVMGVRGTFDSANDAIRDDGTARIAYLKRTFKNT